MKAIGKTHGESKGVRMARSSRLNTLVTKNRVFIEHMGYVRSIVNSLLLLHKEGAISDKIITMHIMEKVRHRIDEGMSFAFIEIVTSSLKEARSVSQSEVMIQAIERSIVVTVAWSLIKTDIQMGNISTEKTLSDRIRVVEQRKG